MFGPSGLKLVVVVGLLGGGHRRGWGGSSCGVLWWVQIGVEVRVEVEIKVEVQIGVVGVVGFVVVLWWVWKRFVPWVFFLIFWWLGVEVLVGGGGCSCGHG